MTFRNLLYLLNIGNLFDRYLLLAWIKTKFPELLDKYSKFNLNAVRERLKVAYEYAKETQDYNLIADHFYNYILYWNLETLSDALNWYIADPTISSIIYKLKGTFDWSMGLGWLTWAVTSTYVNHYVVRPLEQYLSELLRDKELSESKINDFLRYCLVSKEYVVKYLQQQGYKDEDIKLILKVYAYEIFNSTLKKLLHLGIKDASEIKSILKNLGLNEDEADKLIISAYKLPSESKVLEWFKNNAISKGTAINYLTYLGYSPEIAKFIVDYVSKDKTKKDRDLTKSDIKKAYINNIINEDEAIRYLNKLGYDVDEAKLLIELWNREIENNQRTLTYSQIKQLYINNIILRDEAVKRLSDLGYSDKDIEKILKLWDEEKQKKLLKINRSTILNAYRYDIIDKNTAIKYLKQLGYSDEIINIELSLIDKKKQKEPRKPSYSLVLRYFSYGLIDYNTAFEKLKQLGFTDEDAKLLLQLQQKKTEKTSTKLTARQILLAYKKKIISEDVAVELLRLKGYEDFEIEILLNLYK